MVTGCAITDLATIPLNMSGCIAPWKHTPDALIVSAQSQIVAPIAPMPVIPGNDTQLVE